MSHKPGRNVTQAGPKCHTRAKMSHSHVIMRVIAFTNIASDIVKDIATGVCVVIAIIGTFIKISVDKVNYDMVSKICGADQSIGIVASYRKPATIPKSPPTPEAVITTTRAAAGEHGLAAGPKVSTQSICNSQLLLLQI